MIKIAPSILSADFARLGEEIKNVEKAGADWIHIDVMDGHFVPNVTIGAPVVRSIRKVTGLPLDVHLMISNPEKYIKDFADAGSDYITFHFEASDDPSTLLKDIKNLEKKAGISIKPKTDCKELLKLLPDLDLILVMSVEPGFGGQEFIKESLDKIKYLRKAIDAAKSDCLISVDGGINAETAKLVKASGVHVMVAGNAIFNAEDYKKAISQLK
ncbi:MAG: ribulose-phosphate 3-epimerase [Pseudomonadota bacterium]